MTDRGPRGLRLLFPQAEERRLLGRFYLAGFLGECLNVVTPFQFLYLAFVFHETPGNAVLVLLAGSVAVLAFEVPTGMLADRFGRKRSVLLGDVIGGLAFCLVPLAATAPEPWRLPLLCLLFVIDGFGETLVSGAEDAWVADNLEARGHGDWIERYFARENSVTSAAGLVAGMAAAGWTVFSLGEPAAPLLHLFWVVAGVSQIASTLVLLPEPELTPPEEEDGTADPQDRELDDEPQGMLESAGVALKAVGRSGPLSRIVLFSGLAVVAHGAMDEAVDLALVARTAPVWLFPVLWLARDLVGALAPLGAPALGRLVGVRGVLVASVAVPALAATVLLATPGILAVVAMVLVFATAADLARPLVDARVVTLSPRAVRATVGSLVNQVDNFAEIISLGLLLVLMGSAGDGLTDLLPALADAFATGIEHAGGAGLADTAVLVLAAVGLAAVLPLLDRRASLDGPRAVVHATANLAPETDLLATRDLIQTELDRLNPGEEISWWIAAAPFVLPRSTTDTLRAAGPAVHRFFPAARRIAQIHPWTRRLTEKLVHPVYRLLNDAQPGRGPILVRPDVVPDKNWVPRIVELEFTVAGRADVGAMSAAYGLDPHGGAAAEVSRWLTANGLGDATVGVLTAPHPFFLDLPDDAAGWATLLRDQGVDVVVLADRDLTGLRFDGSRLLYHPAHGPPRPLHVVDRFVDVYEIAELQHPGMTAVRDAYLAGAVRDLGSSTQFLDEKAWMALLHDPRLATDWARQMGDEEFSLLRRLVPLTRVVGPDTTVPIDGREVFLRDLHTVPADRRRYVVKESGTSTTASGAQSFHVLSKLSDDETRQLVERILGDHPLYVVQELVESVRVAFDALDCDPVDDEGGNTGCVRQSRTDARVKLSPYYVGGKLCDVRYVAGAVKYAVNDEEFVCGVVRRD